MIKSICLGTVQFGKNYGISNKGGKTEKKEAFRILDYCANKGVEWLDTAEDYGDSQIILGEYLKLNPNTFKIQSKISTKSTSESLTTNFIKTTDQLNVDFLDSYLIHSYEKFVAEEGPFLEQLLKLKDKGNCKSLGVSIYENHHGLNSKILDFADEIQFPYNLFDNNNYRSKLINGLKEKFIGIQIRSIFLQGLFFLEPTKLPNNLTPLKKALLDLFMISKKYNVSTTELALRYAFHNSFADKVLIGVNSLEQLKNNMEIIDRISGNSLDFFEEINNIHINEEYLLNPNNWYA